MKPKNTHLIVVLLLGLTTASVAHAESKDAAVVQAPNGQCYQIRVPHNAAEVNRNGNSFTVKSNPDALKKVEIKPIPCPTPKPAPTRK